MIRCQECDSEISEQDTYCPFCGISLQPLVVVPVAEGDDAEKVEEVLESTLMMPPEELARLASEAGGSDAESSITELSPDDAPGETAREALEIEGEKKISEPSRSKSESEAAGSELPDVPLPTLLSADVRKDVFLPELPDFSLLAGEPADEKFPESQLKPSTLPEAEPSRSLTGTEVSAVEPASADRKKVGGEESFNDSDISAAAVSAKENAKEIESKDEPDASLDIPELMSAKVDGESGISFDKEDKGLSESESKQPKPEAFVSGGTPVPFPENAGEAEEKIDKPAEGLSEFDAFTSGSIFDSVRIMENHPQISADDVQTIARSQPEIPSGASEISASAAPPASGDAVVKKETVDSRTSPNFADSDTDGRKSFKLKPLSEGTVLNGRYEIIRKIGGGGMGAVYLASDNNLGGILRAVKEMVQSHIEEEQQEKAISDFKRESMILSTLDHPSIPTIFDYFYDEHESRFYLVMKYISGGDLASRLRAAPEGRLDERTVTEWAIQIADVLDYLHSQPSPIVYRDLKPSNIMIDGNSGRIMLIDFGIARSISQQQEKGVTAVGTMGYAPPELFSGNVEPRSDIYSLGSTMFHLLTGADPQSNPLLIFDFQKNPRPRQINPLLSDQIEEILMCAVEYNSEARFRTAAELKALLEKHLENLNSGALTYGVAQAPVSISLENQSVFCGFCGQRIVATDLFCAFCGAKQPIAQEGVHSGAYAKPQLTARLFVEGTSELSAPSFSLAKDENLLGRRDPMSNIFPEIDLSKYDPQTKISRRHARIWRDGNSYMLEDLGSSNGTILAVQSEQAIRLVPHKPHPLTSGDRIRVGDTTLHFWAG